MINCHAIIEAAGDIGLMLAKHDDFSDENPFGSDLIRRSVAGQLFQMLSSRNMLIYCLPIAVAFGQHVLSKSLLRGWHQHMQRPRIVRVEGCTGITGLPRYIYLVNCFTIGFCADTSVIIHSPREESNFLQ